MRARETGHGGFLEVMEPRMQNRGTGVTAAKSRIATMSQHSLVPLLAQGVPRKMSLVASFEVASFKSLECPRQRSENVMAASCTQWFKKKSSLILKNGGPKIVFEEWRQRTTRRSLHESDQTSESRIFDLMDMVKGIIGGNR